MDQHAESPINPGKDVPDMKEKNRAGVCAQTGRRREPFRYAGRDWIIAVLITVLVFFLVGGTLTAGLPIWGDDSAAYISEGIAIADNSFREQMKKNYIMHPSELPDEADPEGLVYVWGYPLLLSAVYKLAGFDRIDYSTIIWYKLPLLLCLSLLGGTLYLFYRRRFSAAVSAVLSASVCLLKELQDNMDMLYSDVAFLFFSVLALLLMELFAEQALFSRRAAEGGREQGSLARILFSAASYGAVLWFAYEIRLSGMAVCGAAFLGHAFFLLKNRGEIRRGELWIHAVPYLTMAALVLVSEGLLAPATSNLSDMGKTGAVDLLRNLYYYSGQIYLFLNGLPGTAFKLTGFVLAAAGVIGVLKHGIRENAHLTLLLAGFFLGASLLPYVQGIRYLYIIFPFLLMFVAYGFQILWRQLCRRVSAPRFLRTCVKICAAAMLLLLPLLNTLNTGVSNRMNWDQLEDGNVYSAEAVDMYRYIQQKVPKDKIIAFGKPRSLYLNTERVSIRPGCNGHTVSEADYYLGCAINIYEFLEANEEAQTTPMTVLYSNRLFTLYEVDGG